MVSDTGILKAHGVPCGRGRAEASLTGLEEAAVFPVLQGLFPRASCRLP